MFSYASDPASPVLAHSLLSQTVQDTRDQSIPTERTYNLRKAIEKGIECSSDALFRPGIVIGFSKPRRRGTDDDDNDECTGRIPRYILTSHLLKRPSPSPGSFNTFIIHPFNLTIFSPQNLLTSLLSTNLNPNQSLSREEAITCLDVVQLLPVYDFPAAMQAITQVSETLREIGEHRKHQQLINQDPVVLIMAGLDTLVESVIRASNPIKGTAVLNAALGTLTRLSREYAAFLSVLFVNTSGLGLGMGTGTGDVVVADGGYQGGEQLSVLLPSLLMKTLDQGTDTHLLVSGEKGRAGRFGVEVIKDRVGGWLGRRCIWD